MCNDQCPSQTEGVRVELVCDWPDGHAGSPHWDEGERLLWEQPLADPGVPPYRGDRAAVLRGCVSDLHVAGVRTGADYERLVGEIVTSVYGLHKKPSLVSTATIPNRQGETDG